MSEAIGILEPKNPEKYSLSILPLPDKIHYKLISKQGKSGAEVESIVEMRSFWKALAYFNSISLNKKASVEIPSLNGEILQLTREMGGNINEPLIRVLHITPRNFAPLKVAYEMPFSIFNALFLQAEQYTAAQR